jgi:Mg2+/Co2+ transporter CorC
MGVVCESKQVAVFFRDFSDYIHNVLKVEDTKPKLEQFKFAGKRIVGVLTLEDVIEKMLRVDIVDEGDREEAILKMKEG